MSEPEMTLADRFEALADYSLRAKYERLQAAVVSIYTAAHWTADRPVDEGALWTELRDAAGIEPGKSPERGANK